MFPHLRWFSRSLGLQFHVVDLYHSLPAGWVSQRTREDGGEGEEEGGEEGRKGGGVGGGSKCGLTLEDCGGSADMCGLEQRGVLQLALREIQACQDMSAGPTFVVGSVP